MGIEGYVGTPLHDGQGKIMRLIVALHKSPIKNPEFTKPLSKSLVVILQLKLSEQNNLTAQANVPINYCVDDEYNAIFSQRAAFFLLNKLLSLNIKSAF